MREIICKSNISLAEVSKRLAENTKKGNPKLKGSPLASTTMFRQKSKKLFGEISGKQFRITKNGVMFSIPYILNGRYKTDKNLGIIVSYEIEKIWFGYLWIRIMPLLALIVVNSNFIFNKQNTDKLTLIPINVFLLLMFTPLLIIRHQKNKFVRQFHGILELNQIEK